MFSLKNTRYKLVAPAFLGLLGLYLAATGVLDYAHSRNGPLSPGSSFAPWQQNVVAGVAMIFFAIYVGMRRKHGE
jgi:hypothetical protein